MPTRARSIESFSHRLRHPALHDELRQVLANGEQIELEVEDPRRPQLPDAYPALPAARARRRRGPHARRRLERQAHRAAARGPRGRAGGHPGAQPGADLRAERRGRSLDGRPRGAAALRPRRRRRAGVERGRTRRRRDRGDSGPRGDLRGRWNGAHVLGGALPDRPERNDSRRGRHRQRHHRSQALRRGAAPRRRAAGPLPRHALARAAQPARGHRQRGGRHRRGGRRPRSGKPPACSPGRPST